MEEKGFFQIWHKIGKSGNIYTALVSVDKWGKLQFVFDDWAVLLALNCVPDSVKNEFGGIFGLKKSEKLFIYDFDSNEFKILQ